MANNALYTPSLERVKRLAAQGKNLIPVVREVLADFETPLTAFLKIEGEGPAYLLESVEGGEQVARYSFLGSAPKFIFRSCGRSITLTQGKRKRSFHCSEDPLVKLKSLLAPYRYAPLPGLPRFAGGLVGFAGYDLVRFYEPVPKRTTDDLKTPETLFLLSDTVVIFDHVEHRLKVVSHIDLTGAAKGKRRPSAQAVEKAYWETVRKINGLVYRLQGRLPQVRNRSRRRGKFKVSSNVTYNRFLQMVRKAKKAISEGEIIQGVLSQRFSTQAHAHPFNVYRSLRSLNPSPYMFYLKLGELTLIGSSPEILVRCEGSEVRTRPIAGTRPRGQTPQKDKKLERELKADPKERAEHLMLVDLGRNDLGRVCQYGSVKVKSFMETERYSHVMHLVTDVAGKKAKGTDAFDCLRAAFPAGTVAGAPKVRAMQIIESLEPTRRGPYAGAVGYIGFSGNMDAAITIRTILMKGTQAHVQAGAGIVADSNPKREYQETCNKAAGMLEAIRLAEQEMI